MPAVRPILSGLLLCAFLSGTVTAEPSPVDSSDGEAIFRLLTTRTWTNRAPDFKHPFGFCPVGEGDSEYRFVASGEYEHWFHLLSGPEPILKASGRWTLQRNPCGRWHACLSSGERFPVTLHEGGRIQLDGWKYPLKELNVAAKPGSISELPPLELPEEVKARIQILTSRTWHRANDVNLDRFPATVRFRPDFGLDAHSASGREHPIGTWYVTGDSALGSGPPDPLGEGDYLRNYGAFFRIEIVAKDLIVLENAPYVPAENMATRGTIWDIGVREISGGAEPAMRVEVVYDRPVRRGIPCRFEIRFVNAHEVVLQRFSITEDYDHHYRQPDGSLATVNELAAIDLGDTPLPAGGSRVFQMTAVFPDSGEHTYYLNAMLRGHTQADKREAVTFRIADP